MAGLDTIIEAFGSITQALIPDSNADPRIQYLWRVRVGVVLCGTFFGLMIVTGLAFGLLKWTGFPGFASGTDISELAASQKADIATITSQRDTDKKQQATEHLGTLDTRILDLRIKHCEATSSDGRRLYWSKIQPKMEEFMTLSGHEYPLPDCKDL